MPTAEYYIPEVESWTLESRNVEQAFCIHVMQPIMRHGSPERFPAVYLTDANLLFDVARGIAHALHIAGEVRRFILVGIAYPGANPFAGEMLRWRDLTSNRRPRVPGLPPPFPMRGIAEPKAGKPDWHGAARFLDFIIEELLPIIEARYPTLSGDRTYAGYSLGGGFGWHALFARRGLFQRYLLVSPSLSYCGVDYGIQEARDHIALGGAPKGNVFMAVGELEELDDSRSVSNSQFVSSAYRMAAVMRAAQSDALSLTCRVFPGETHASVWPVAFSHGVRALFGAPERAPMSD